MRPRGVTEGRGNVLAAVGPRDSPSVVWGPHALFDRELPPAAKDFRGSAADPQKQAPARGSCFWRFAGHAAGQRADLLSAARGAHDAGELRVAIRGASSAARGDQDALAIAEKQSSAVAERRC